METKYIKLKENDALKSLSALTGKSVEDLNDRIIKKAIDAGVVLDDEASCGGYLIEFFEQAGYKAVASTLYTLCKSTNEIVKLFSGLIVFGKSGDCEYCGCERERIDGEKRIVPGGCYDTEPEDDWLWEMLKCTNCQKMKMVGNELD